VLSAYDALGRMATVVAGANVTFFVYSGSEMVAERVTGNGVLARRYVYGPEIPVTRAITPKLPNYGDACNNP
jgi:hypothetical protein